MAKKREPSKHSRAARRATSPGIDTDKSLKDFKPPSRNTARPSVLAVQQSAGIHKKARRGRQMSAKAKRRHEKGIEMGEAILERTGKKLQRSLGRERLGKERRKAWDAINKDVEEEVGDVEGDSDGVAAAEKDWETDEDMDAGKDSEPAKKVAEAAPEPAPEPEATKPHIYDDDEIL
ncbi:Alb1-domain-containing protein [Stachybotrys elegans]|uniref:Alb1-domain-containing protein n=1 Tax=Stachybotrys elegans TaxID=80388 RepID=A0A8K0SQY7_9HYPO|nr:Alb1-domain-containing protein [Stachybotrys elegans]